MKRTATQHVSQNRAGKNAAASKQGARGSHARNLTGALAISLLALLTATFFPAKANAHTQLISVNPANKSTVESFPTAITMTFNESLLHLGTKEVNKLYAHTPDHDLLKTGPVKVNGEVISIPVLEKNPKAGTYTIYYRVISNDGHPVSGVETFNYKNASASREITILQPVNFDHFWHLHKLHTVETVAALALIIAWAIYRRRNRD